MFFGSLCRVQGVWIFAGSRYIEDVYGLRISNITLDDEGLYYCCAEVESTGRYYEKEINVLVCSKPFLCKFVFVNWNWIYMDCYWYCNEKVTVLPVPTYMAAIQYSLSIKKSVKERSNVKFSSFNMVFHNAFGL